jgi:hypothetical protein
MYMILKIILITILTITMYGCTHTAIVKLPCPPLPEMEEVKVKDGTISPKYKENVKTNHIRLWKYIEHTGRLGCTLNGI